MVTENRARQLLEEAHDWPSLYTFKFIVPAARVPDVELLFPPETKIQHRASSGGKYVSVTGVALMESPDAVLAIYAAAKSIDGIVGL